MTIYDQVQARRLNFYKVTTAGGHDNIHHGATYRAGDPGSLEILDQDGAAVVTYAPGAWRSVECMSTARGGAAVLIVPTIPAGEAAAFLQAVDVAALVERALAAELVEAMTTAAGHARHTDRPYDVTAGRF